MGTRAVYFFKDSDAVYGVYKHYDGYPKGAVSHIEDAKAYAWPLPRWEADEFSSAFVTANKNKKGGEIRLLPMFDHTSIDMVMDDYMCCDYYYVLSWNKHISDMVVEMYQRNADGFSKFNEMPHQAMLKFYSDEPAQGERIYKPVDGCEECEFYGTACPECVLYGDAELIKKKRYAIRDKSNGSFYPRMRLDDILEEINRDKPKGLTDYDETNWREGLKHLEWELIEDGQA